MKELALIGVLLFQAPAARPPSSIVSGQIVFSDGAAAAGIVVAPVRILEPGALAPLSFPFRTDSKGVFRFSNLSPGRYYIRVGGNGEVFTYYPGVATENDATVVTVAAGASIDDLNFALPASASGVSVLGHVTFPPNRPAQAATPRVQISGPVGQFTSAIAADGTFEIPHVRPGRYNIAVTPAPGMQPQPIVVSADDLRGIELVVPRLTTVAGTVATESGSARLRFTMAFDGRPVYRTNVAVAPDGMFSTALPEGEYLLRITGLPAGYYLKSLATDKSDLLAKPLKIAATDSAVPIAMTLGMSPGVKVSGRVKVSSRDAEPASAKSILLSGSATSEAVDALLEPDGSFEFAKVMPGAYLARVTLASNLGAPLVPVVIPNKDVGGLEILVPGEVEVFGRVDVDGYGPPPKFSLLLVRGPGVALSAAKPGEIPTLPANAAPALLRAGGNDGMEGVELSVNALPDGSFKIRLPEGSYRVAAVSNANAIPPRYLLRSLTYGPADLLKEPMTVSAEKPSEMLVGFGTTLANPWVKVSGRVVGADPAKGPFRAALEGRTTATIETPVNQDGSFEFPRVLQGASYSARLVPPNDAASAAPVLVRDKDVGGVEIVVPSEKEVRVVTTMDGDAQIPGFVMTLAGSGSTVTVAVKPERDGAFRAKLPADERRVRITGFPLGYVLKSANYGSVDLLKQPLKPAGDDLEIRVTLAADPAFPFGNLRGRVTGADTQRGNIQLLLNGVTSFSSFETAVNPDGSFSFSKIPQGMYVPTLAGASVSGLLSPSTVVVSGSDFFGIEITAPKQSARPNRPPADEGPTGAVVTNLGGTHESAGYRSAGRQV